MQRIFRPLHWPGARPRHWSVRLKFGRLGAVGRRRLRSARTSIPRARAQTSPAVSETRRPSCLQRPTPNFLTRPLQGSHHGRAAHASAPAASLPPSCQLSSLYNRHPDPLSLQAFCAQSPHAHWPACCLACVSSRRPSRSLIIIMDDGRWIHAPKTLIALDVRAAVHHTARSVKRASLADHVPTLNIIDSTSTKCLASYSSLQSQSQSQSRPVVLRPAQAFSTIRPSSHRVFLLPPSLVSCSSFFASSRFPPPLCASHPRQWFARLASVAQLSKHNRPLRPFLQPGPWPGA